MGLAQLGAEMVFAFLPTHAEAPAQQVSVLGHLTSSAALTVAVLRMGPAGPASRLLLALGLGMSTFSTYTKTLLIAVYIRFSGLCPGSSDIQCCVRSGSSGGGGSGGSCPPSVQANIIDFIKSFEGFSGTPYNDVAGFPTVGYGHLCSTSGCTELGYSYPISTTQGEQLLARDVRVSLDKFLNLQTIADESQEIRSLSRQRSLGRPSECQPVRCFGIVVFQRRMRKHAIFISRSQAQCWRSSQHGRGSGASQVEQGRWRNCCRTHQEACGRSAAVPDLDWYRCFALLGQNLLETMGEIRRTSAIEKQKLEVSTIPRCSYRSRPRVFVKSCLGIHYSYHSAIIFDLKLARQQNSQEQELGIVIASRKIPTYSAPPFTCIRHSHT